MSKKKSEVRTYAVRIPHPAIVIASLLVSFLMMSQVAFAWADAAYGYRMPIYTRGYTGATTVFLNGTSETKGIAIIANAGNNTHYLYSKNGNGTGEIMIGTDALQSDWYFAQNGTGNNPFNLKNNTAVAEWHFENRTETNTTDQTYNGNNLVVTGNPNLESCVFGNGFGFSGAGSWVGVEPNEADNLDGFDQATIITWFINNQTMPMTDAAIVAKKDTYFIRIEHSGVSGDRIDIYWYNAAASAELYTAWNDLPPSNQPTMIATGFNDTHVWLMVNETYVMDAALGGDVRDTSTDGFGIGNYYNGGSALWQGCIDYTTILNQSLSKKDVVDYYIRMKNGTYFGADEVLGNAPTVSFTSPVAAKTYQSNDIDARFRVTDDSASFEVKVYLDGTLIYDNASFANNTILTLALDSNVTIDNSWNLTVYTNDGVDATQYERAFSTALYSSTTSFRGHVNNDLQNYSRTEDVQSNVRCGYIGQSIRWNMTANGTVENSTILTCDNVTRPFILNYTHDTETIVNITTALYHPNNTLFRAEWQNYTEDFTAPNSTWNYELFTLGFRNITNETVNVTVNDTISPIQFCNITVNIVNQTNVTFGNNQTSYPFNITDGYNIFSAVCWDIVGNIDNNTESRFMYAKRIILINEADGSEFNQSRIQSIRAISEDNKTIFNFTYEGVNEVRYLYNSTSDTIRIEKKYAGLTDLITSEIDFSLTPETDVRTCVAEYQTFYQILFYASTAQEVAVINNIANCYVLAGYTRYAYQDALSAKAMTIDALYYLYTWAGGSQIFLSTIDGAQALSINIDVLQFTRTSYDFSLFEDDIAVTKLGNSTLMIYYNNPENDNTKLVFKIYDGTTELFTRTDTTTPNEIIVYFDYSSLTISSDMLKLEATITKDDGTTETKTLYFTLYGSTGLISSGVAIGLSFLVFIFGLTFTSMRDVFGVFGLITTGAAIGITTLAAADGYIRLVQVIYAIAIVYQIIIFKEEYAGVH